MMALGRAPNKMEFNPVALRKAKIVYNFGISECKRMKSSGFVQILYVGTDRSQQTVQTKIRLLLKKQSDQGLRSLPFHQHLLDALMQCYIKHFYF